MRPPRTRGAHGRRACMLTRWISPRSGGNDPGTSNKWSKATCCPSGAFCKQVNQFYSQCVKNSS